MPIHPILRSLAAPAALAILAACGNAGARETTVTDDLSRDLELAAAVGVELAPGARGASVVSAVERIPQRAPSTATRRAPERRERTPAPRPARVTEPDAVPEVSEEVQSVAQAEAPTVEPQIERAPGPVMMPQNAPGRVVIGEGDQGRGGTGIGVIGTIAGVVLRGGAVGEDDCELHHPRRRGRNVPPGGVLGPVVANTGILVNRRYPQGRPTY